ncbi:MAG: hypothetical protein R3C44_11195 [Chloroflexota bacterium]
MIRHEPLGIEHPYDPLPWERFPRYPVADEPVLLGAVTEGAPDVVWAEVQTDNNASPITVQGVVDGERWLVTLPGFAAGQRVRYRLVARGLTGETTTDWYPV